MSHVARFDTDAKFWADWDRNWLLYGTVYAINNPEPRIVPAETLTVHEGPCPGDMTTVYLPMDCPVCGRHRVEWDGKVLRCEKCTTSSEWDGFEASRYRAAPPLNESGSVGPGEAST